MKMREPIQEDLINDMNMIACVLDEKFKPYGFCLLVFPVGSEKGGRMNYISNAVREDMLKALKEFIYANESGQPPVSQEIQ
jgi:hypothetical protein